MALTIAQAEARIARITHLARTGLLDVDEAQAAIRDLRAHIAREQATSAALGLAA